MEPTISERTIENLEAALDNDCPEVLTKDPWDAALDMLNCTDMLDVYAQPDEDKHHDGDAQAFVLMQVADVARVWQRLRPLL